jgi:putative ABC transport system permease protein
MSGGLGSILSLPVSRVLGIIIGNSFMSSPLSFSFSWQGWLMWLVGSLLVAALASLLPARTAVRLTIREVINYE